MNIEEIKAKYALLNDAATDKKKRYEVHFQAQDAKGNFFNLVKEAVCKPGELKSILKKFESEQKAKGNKIVSELYRKSFAVDSFSVNDASESSFKVGTVVCHKTAEGDVKGEVDFVKNGKHWSAGFTIYSTGNWEEKPNPGTVKLSLIEKKALLEAAKKKLSALGIKAK